MRLYAIKQGIEDEAFVEELYLRDDTAACDYATAVTAATPVEVWHDEVLLVSIERWSQSSVQAANLN